MSVLDPRLWLAVLLAMLGAFGTGLFIGDLHRAGMVKGQELEQVTEARRFEQRRASLAQGINDAKDAQLRLVNARLANALDELRQRPDRLPEPARAACEGATGAELSGRDAAFLERLAARADALRAELGACQDREHAGAQLE